MSAAYLGFEAQDGVEAHVPPLADVDVLQQQGMEVRNTQNEMLILRQILAK